jgi:hypothetical protein
MSPLQAREINGGKVLPGSQLTGGNPGRKKINK